MSDEKRYVVLDQDGCALTEPVSRRTAVEQSRTFYLYDDDTPATIALLVPCDASGVASQEALAAIPQVRSVLDLHTPFDTEAEFYCHDDRGRDADEGCASFDECPGHMIQMRVCSECGHDHEDSYPMYRPWPCPTVRALTGDTE